MSEQLIIQTKKAPAAVGPYSQGVVCGNLLFTAGQVGLNPQTGLLVEGGIEAQTRQVLENLKAVLLEAGSSLEKVLKTTVFLTSLDNFASMNEIYAAYFSQKPPARSCVEVSKLPKDALIEIEAVAYL